MRAVSMSQKGTRSEFNEDACLVMPNLGVFVVADGVGGGPSGHEASRSVVEALYGVLSGGGFRDESSVREAINAANVEVYNKAESEGLRGMASTLVIAWKDNDVLRCFNVGDSRIYRLRNGELEQLTKDHTTKIVKNNREKMVVTRAMGVKPSVEAELTSWDWKESDVVLLMSDGISDPLQDHEIEQIVSQEKRLMVDKVKLLISESISRGCEDDKTVILAFS